MTNLPIKQPAYLLEEQPLTVYPSLALLLGINEALIFQRLHFLLKGVEQARNMSSFLEGRWWVYNSYPMWLDHFPWISESTLKRAFLDLEGKHLVLTQQSVKLPSDRKKWYTIDYSAWEMYLADPQNDLMTIRSKRPDQPSGQNDPVVRSKRPDGLTKSPSKNKGTTTAAAASKKKPRYGIEVNWALVEGSGGALQKSDGSFVLLDGRHALARDAILLFNAYLDVLRGFGRLPLDGDEALWDTHQEAALRLALAGVTVEQVQRYITFRYTDPKDKFWQTFPGQMKLEHLAKTLPTFEYPLPEPEKGASADNAHPVTPEFRERIVHTKEEIEASNAKVEAEMRAEAEAHRGE